MTVIGGASGAKTIVPPPTPGPWPDAPEIKVSPTGRPRLCAGIVVPRVSVTFASIWTSWPAHSAILPSVVVSAWNTRTSRPALSRMLPLVVVIGALTLMSRPQHTTRLPLVAVIARLMLTSRKPFRVSVVGLPEAVHEIASFTKMSPLPPVASGVIVLMTTLLVTSCAESVAPEMLPPVGAMMKSAGSISQVPVTPNGAAVVILTPSAMLTVAADVSMNPPLPPSGALASSVPAMFAVPLCMSPSSRIFPLRLPSVRASMTPVLLTTVRNNCPAACAVSRTCPPSARIIPPLLTSALTAPVSTVTLSRPSPATSSVTPLPEASATVPSRATIVPWLLTFAPSSAT